MFEPNELVLYTCPSPSLGKLTPTYRGPFRVMERLGASCYIIKSVQDPKEKLKTAHVSQLKKFYAKESLEPQRSTESASENIESEIEEEFKEKPEERNDLKSGRRNRTRPNRFKNFILY